MKEVKTGLVLEGGAMRGMYTAGILDVLMEEKIQVDGVIGVSAGAVFGCNYKSGQIGRTLRYNMKFCGDKRYGTLHSLLKTGDIYDVDLCYHQIPEILIHLTMRHLPKTSRIFCGLHRCGNRKGCLSQMHRLRQR